MVKLPRLEYVNGSAVVPKTLPTQLSVAVGVVTVTEHSPVAVVSTGNAGAVISCTITVWLAVDVFLLPSFTDHLIVLVPWIVLYSGTVDVRKRLTTQLSVA